MTAAAYILVLWTMVGTCTNCRSTYDWRPIGEFSSLQACESAGRLMGAESRIRCLPKEQP